MKPIQKYILAIFIIIPLIELFLLIEVGSVIGVFPTILLVIFTAVLGANLMRKQGLTTWQRLQSNLTQGILPAYDLIDGLLLLLGGILLLTPGFFTDALGFACLVPAIRKKMAHFGVEHQLFKMMSTGGPFQKSSPPEQDALDGEFKREDN